MVLAETALAEDQRELARAWLGELRTVDGPEPMDEALALRLELLRVEIGGEGRAVRARRFAALAERAQRAGLPALARSAAGAAAKARGATRPPPVSEGRPLARSRPSD